VKRKLALVAAAGVVFAAFVFHERILASAGAYLVKAEEPRHAQAALVLAGDFYGNRVLKGAELARGGYVPKVLVSGPAGTYGYYEDQLAIPFAVKDGYPESYFEGLEHNARSTQEEADYTIPELRRRGIHDVLLVTSNFHSRRAGRIFRKSAPDIHFTVIASPDVHFAPGSWWHDREGRKTFLYEWEKTVASWFGL
jgi:uncharacterized SAM-binding protein YcdF (DUF218 family)